MAPYSLVSLTPDDNQPSDPVSVRFRSIAEIMLRGIQRCVAVDRELQDEPGRTSGTDEPVLGNLGDSLPEPLAFVSNKASRCLASPKRWVLATPKTLKTEGICEQRSKT